MAKRSPSNELLRLCPRRLSQLRLEECQGLTELAATAGMSRNTLNKCLGGEPVSRQTVAKLKQALKIRDISPYLLFDAVDGAIDDWTKVTGDAALAEWLVREPVGGDRVASNGLRYRVFRLEHESLGRMWGRGKRYDLLSLPDAEAERVAERLLRHPKVCRRVEGDPRFPRNERVVRSQDTSGFWVIDQWTPGVTLEERLLAGPIDPDELAMLAREVLEGLLTLHNVGVVCRELAPRRLIVSLPAGRVVFTELELAKVLEGAPTVAGDWREDPYRAPEAEGPNISAKSDLYSWAQVVVHCLTGEAPPSPANDSLVELQKLPEGVARVVRSSLSISPQFRPEPARVAEALREWGAK